MAPILCREPTSPMYFTILSSKSTMRLLSGGVLALLWSQHCQSQALPVITKTVYRSCPVMTTQTFPSLGWVTSDGSSLPFTFPQPQSSASGSLDASLLPAVSPQPSRSDALPILDSTVIVLSSYQSGSSGIGIASSIVDLSSPMFSRSTISPSTTQPTISACVTVSERPVSCPASNGTLYFTTGSCAGINGIDNSFLIFCGRNYGGTTLSPLSGVSSEAACISECPVDPNCVAVGYDITTLTCIKRSEINLNSVVSAPGIIFAIQRQYYVSLQLEQPAEAVPPITSLTTTSIATTPPDGISPTVPPEYRSNTQQSLSATISSVPDEMSSFTTPLVPGTYIYGGTALRAVIGGTTSTYTIGGQLSTAVTGGLTTTYTSGGITATIAGPVPTPTSEAVRDAVIGSCPAYNSRLYTGPETEGTAYLVACGERYNGTVSGRESLLKRAVGVECISRCQALSDCAALSYSSGVCTYYSEVNGQMDSEDPAFSAVRLDEDEDPSEDIQPAISASQVLSTTTTVSVSTSLSEVPESTTTSVGPTSLFTVTSTTTAFGQTTTVLSVSTQDASTKTVILPASTATILLTISVPVIVTAIAPPSIIISTARGVSTLLGAPPTLTQQVTITQPASSYSFTTTMTSQVPGSTVISTNVLITTIENGATVTSTERVFATLPGSTITNVQVITTTAPGSILVSTFISVPPAVTQDVTFTQAASSYNVTRTVTSLIPGTTSISTILRTTTLGDGSTIVSTQQVITTLPASTVTSIQVLTTTAAASMQFGTQTIISTQPVQFVTTFLPESEIISTEITTVPASTLTISDETTLRETSTLLRTISVADRIITQTITSAFPASTLTVISVSTVSGSTITNFVTRTEGAVMVVSTVQEATVILTVVSTAAVSTYLTIRPTTIVSTLLQPTTVVSTRNVETTVQASTVYVVSTTTSVVPASTLTQTLRTTLAAETVVVTSSAPGQTTTRAFTTSLGGSTITTTSLSVRPASTATYTTSVVSYISYGRITCPQDSGLEYAGADGSRYMILCGKDYSGTSGDGSSANIYGINPVAARDLGTCVNACTSQGTACVGVSWQAANQLCVLKRTMFPTDISDAVSGFDSVVRIFAGTEPAPVMAVSQFDNGGFDTGALAPWIIAFQDGASVAVANNSAVVSLTGDNGYLNLQQSLRVPVAAASSYAYYMTFSIGTSGLTQDGALAAIFFNSYGLGAINYPSNQAQTKVYLSGRLDSDDITALTLLSQSLSSDLDGQMTFDDIYLTTYEQKPGLNAISIPPVVSNATYRFVDLAVVEYTIPQLEFRQTFTLAGNVQIQLADSTTTCWLAIGFYPFSQQVVYQAFTTNGTVTISASGYFYAVTTSFDFEFNCQGVAGSVLTISSFFLRAF